MLGQYGGSCRKLPPLVRTYESQFDSNIRGGLKQGIAEARVLNRASNILVRSENGWGKSQSLVKILSSGSHTPHLNFFRIPPTTGFFMYTI